jgi:hypothetical protein
MNLRETANALARIRGTFQNWESGELNAAILTESLTPLGEKSILDPVVHDAARKLIQQGGYTIISPSRNHFIGPKDYDPHPSDTPETAMKKEAARMAHIRNKRLLTEEKMIPSGASPEHVHIAYNYAKAARMSERLRERGIEHVHATGGFRESGSEFPRGMIPTEASFVIRNGPKFGFHEAVDLASEFGQDSFIHHGAETDHLPKIVTMHYHPETQEQHPKHEKRFSVEPWAFDPHRVRTMSPTKAHALSMGGKEVAFTHHWTPASGYEFHNPPRKLTQPAWRFVGGDEPASRLDIPHQ